VDVVGPGGELIAAGGPGKATNLGGLGENLARLKTVANARGVRALAYFEEGTPGGVLGLARKLLGSENVHLFPR
jgi:filamentous hemagglutinin